MSNTFSEIIFDIQTNLKKFDETLRTFGFQESKDNFTIEELIQEIDLKNQGKDVYDSLKDGFCFLPEGERILN